METKPPRIISDVMKRRPFLALLVATNVITLAVGAYALLALHASDKLLRDLAIAKPGMNVRVVRDKLGPEMQAFRDVDDITRMGSIKDARFCDGRKLFIFYSSMPPTRALEVYTDRDDTVVFVSWQHL